MSPGLQVIAPGLHSTIQDLGRRGYQDIGVPLSGALDRIGLSLANALVGNAANAPALEILVQGPLLAVAAASVRVALVGVDGGLVIEGERGRAVASGQSARLTRGQKIRIATLGKTFCAYLAIEGGFDVATCLGSAATYARNRLGGWEGRALQAGDLLPVRSNEAEVRPELALGQTYDPGLAQPIRVVLGPQQDYFTADAVNTFLSATYAVSAQADRMGFRLDGPKLAHAKGYDIVSDGIVAGAVQVPGSGQPIVMLADAQTTGGYAKIATVISADVPALARRRPGAAVRFAAVTQAEAETKARARERSPQPNLATADGARGACRGHRRAPGEQFDRRGGQRSRLTSMVRQREWLLRPRPTRRRNHPPIRCASTERIREPALSSPAAAGAA